MNRASVFLGIATLAVLASCAPVAPSPATDTPIPATDAALPTSTAPTAGLQLAADKLRLSGLQNPVLFTLPGMDRVMVDNVPYKEGSTLDVYYPPDFDPNVPAPAVIFVFGISDSSALTMAGSTFKEMGQYISWGQLVAASGLIGVTYEVTSEPRVDIHDAITYVWENGPALGINPDRFCLWASSSHSIAALGVLTDTTSDYRGSLACGVIYYGDTRTINPLRSDVPLFIVEAGQDSAGTNRRIEEFVDEAKSVGVEVEFVIYPDGLHGFEVEQDTDDTQDIVKRTLEFLATHLMTP